MSVNIQAQFKKDRRGFNGLDEIRDDLIAHPTARRYVVGIVEVTRITRDIKDGGVETPTVNFTSIEALTGESAEMARKLLDETYHQRTGQGAPPPSLFDDVDSDGPEGEAGAEGEDDGDDS